MYRNSYTISTMWKNLVERLMQSGRTQAEIAKFCGCSQPAISSIRSGITTDPRFSIGSSLRTLDARNSRIAKNIPDSKNPV